MIEVVLAHDLVVDAGASATLAVSNVLSRTDASGNNVTALTVDGDFNLNGFNQIVDTLAGSGTITLPNASVLTVGSATSTVSSSFTGTLTGSGTLVNDGSASTLTVVPTAFAGELKAREGTLRLQVDAAGEMAGILTGTANIEKIGDGTLTLSGSNMFSGSLMVSSGGLVAGSGTAFGNNSAVSLANATGAYIDLNDRTVSIGSLAGGGGAGGNVLLGNGTLVVNGDDTSTAFAGAIVGNGGIRKTGTGTLMLTGDANTYTGTTTVAGGTLQIDSALSAASGQMRIEPNGTLIVNASVPRPILGSGNSSAIIADTNDVVLGSDASFLGFNHAGTLAVGSNHVTLNSRGFAVLGSLTTVEGGTLAAPSGISMGTGANLSGSGTVDARVAAAFGSSIHATGSLTLGDATSYAGFTSDGELFTNQHEVTIHDRNVAVLGSLTALGNGTAGGVLTAGNAQPSDNYSHFLLEQGKNLVGRGEINGHFKNHGDAIGDGPGAGERLVFNSPWTVSGKGTFTNTMVLGTFAPGDSPAIITGHNQGFGGTVEIELGGLTPGFGDDNHDQINDTGTILLQDESELAILPWNDFVPSIGDQFVVMTWEEGLTGTFDSVSVDPWFISHGILFSTTYVNPTGAGSLILTAAPVPEPGTALLLLFGVWITLPIRRRNRR